MGRDPVKAALRLSGNDGQPFLSCSGYPGCKFAEDWDPHVSRLADEVGELRREMEQLRAQVKRGSGSHPDISRALRAIIAFAHPDRWPEAPKLAHEVTAQLNALRERL